MTSFIPNTLTDSSDLGILLQTTAFAVAAIRIASSDGFEETSNSLVLYESTHSVNSDAERMDIGG